MLNRITRRISSAIVNRNSLIFNLWYDKMAQPVVSHAATDPEIDLIVGEIRKNGVAVMKNVFPAEFVEEVKAELEKGIAGSDAAFQNAPPDLLRVDRPEEGIIFSQNFKDCGRQMIDWIDLATMPAPIRKFASEPRFMEIVRRYWHVDPSTIHVGGVRLTPCPTDDAWHIDSICDQMKVMLCVSEVTSDNGPMIYKLKTHDHPRVLHDWYFNAYRYGKSDAYGKKSAENRKGSDYAGLGNIQAESICLAGKPGDCFVFDTRGVHMASACKQGTRWVAIAGYALETRRNRALVSLKKPGNAF